MKRIGILAAAFVLTGSPNLQARQKSNPAKPVVYFGIVQKCYDGDTCTVMSSENQKIKVRLSGIDAPEKKQSLGKEAQNFTEGLLKNKQVRLECEGKSYDRTTCTVFLNDEDMNARIVRQGLAYDVIKYSKGKYLVQMQAAQKEGIGVWKENPIGRLSPFCYRHQKDKRCLRNSAFIEQ